jgi:hypothetical protein
MGHARMAFTCELGRCSQPASQLEWEVRALTLMSVRSVICRVLAWSGFSFGLVGGSRIGIDQYLHSALSSSSTIALWQQVVTLTQAKGKWGRRIQPHTWRSSSSCPSRRTGRAARQQGVEALRHAWPVAFSTQT